MNRAGLTNISVAALGGWGLATFIYFKVAFDWIFRADISIIGAFLLAILFTIQLTIIHDSFKFWDKIDLLKYLVQRGSICRLTVSYVSLFLLGNLVLFGFSKELSQEWRILYYKNRLYDKMPQVDYENVLAVGLIFLIPVVVQFAGSAFLNPKK